MKGLCFFGGMDIFSPWVQMQRYEEDIPAAVTVLIDVRSETYGIAALQSVTLNPAC